MTLTDEEIAKLTDEERFEWLKARNAEMQRQQEENPVPRERAVSGRTSADWLDRAFGIFADSPNFERATQYGREWRESFRPKDGAAEHSTMFSTDY